MIYTHVLNKGGRGVKSPLDSGGGADLPPLVREIVEEYRVLAVRSLVSNTARTHSGFRQLPERAGRSGM